MRLPRAIAGLAISLCLVACSGTGGQPVSSQASVAPTSAPGAGGPTVLVASSGSLGDFLTGSDGMTLYTYSGDGTNTSTCVDACAAAWPPLTLAAGTQPVAAAGITGDLGTLTRADGTTQVTHDGSPLYYWQGDAKPGDVTGDGVNGFAVAKATGTAPAPSAGGKPGY
jgi:predicted lipoprotein with Yx(FWY)xxD motif